MKHGNFEVPKGLLAHLPGIKGPQITEVSPERWAKPNVIPLADGSGKDRFGNRIYYSPDLAYTDRRDTVVRAGILLSPDGQRLLHDMPGCLRQLNTALNQMSDGSSTQIGFKHGTLSDIRQSGVQSRIYVWETPQGRKYVLKIPHPKPIFVNDEYRLDQPYINEMLVTQELSHRLEEFSKNTGVTLSKFLFASPTVSCTDFEEGRHPVHRSSLKNKFAQFFRALTEEVDSSRESGNPLFRDIFVDTEHNDNLPPSSNIILKPDGTIVLIDPFVNVGPASDYI